MDLMFCLAITYINGTHIAIENTNEVLCDYYRNIWFSKAGNNYYRLYKTEQKGGATFHQGTYSISNLTIEELQEEIKDILNDHNRFEKMAQKGEIDQINKKIQPICEHCLFALITRFNLQDFGDSVFKINNLKLTLEKELKQTLIYKMKKQKELRKSIENLENLIKKQEEENKILKFTYDKLHKGMKQLTRIQNINYILTPKNIEISAKKLADKFITNTNFSLETKKYIKVKNEIPGIYFLLAGFTIVYIGESLCVPVRITAHSDKTFDYWVYIPTYHLSSIKRKAIEKFYINKYNPIYNKQLKNTKLKFKNEKEIHNLLDITINQHYEIIKPELFGNETNFVTTPQ